MGKRIKKLLNQLFSSYIGLCVVFVAVLLPIGFYLIFLFEQQPLGFWPWLAQKQALAWAFVLFGALCFLFFGLALGLVLRRVTQPMKASMLRAVMLERDFVANASHELKTPITIIRGFAETLYDHPELKRDVVQEITGKIVSNCERMETLVRNLLTLASIDEGVVHFRIREFDLVDVAEEAKAMVMMVHPDAAIDIETVGEPVIMRGDSDLILQALLNLIDNAVKYSKPPALVKVTLEKKDREVVVRVQDRGIGISLEHLGRIFERFYAVDKSYSRSMGGSGLGLSIVKGIVERHGGRVEVTSTSGVGSTFTLYFPDREAPL